MVGFRTLYKAAGLVVGLALAVFVLCPAASADATFTSNGLTRTSGASPSNHSAGVAGPSVFFSDLGSPVNYNCCTGWTVSGTGGTGTSFTAANLFTAAVSGSVTQIDLGVGWVLGPFPFVASIWTDVNNLPGTQLPGASWSGLLANAEFGLSTNSLVTIPVSGVSLTGGTSYFMILAPTSVNDGSWNAWNLNAQNVNGLDLFSTDGGMTWTSNGITTLGAFDILGSSSASPEPGTLILLGTGLLGLGGIVRRRLAARG